MTEKKKRRLIRSGDAAEVLDWALATADPEKRKRYLDRAALMRWAGQLNESRGYHLGRPKGSSRKDRDAKALAFMDRVARETGETRPHTLARAAIREGHVEIGNTQPRSHAMRLAERWKKRQALD